MNAHHWEYYETRADEEIDAMHREEESGSRWDIVAGEEWHSSARRMAREARAAHADLIRRGESAGVVPSELSRSLRDSIEELARQGEFGQRDVIDDAIALQKYIRSSPCICWPACSAIGADGCRDVCDHCDQDRDAVCECEICRKEMRDVKG